jgi:hypothetical protein
MTGRIHRKGGRAEGGSPSKLPIFLWILSLAYLCATGALTLPATGAHERTT